MYRYALSKRINRLMNLKSEGRVFQTICDHALSSNLAGVARLFKMRGQQGGLRELQVGLHAVTEKWRPSINPVQSVISFGEAQGGLGY